MEIAAKLDDIGKPAWIGLALLGFLLYWPVGLAVVAYLYWSGRIGRGSRLKRWDSPVSEMRGRGGWCGRGSRSSGNRAFDEYKADTLRRLEDEQREFVDFLERLRMAKDKAEFDQCMADRRRPTEKTDAQPQS